MNAETRATPDADCVVKWLVKAAIGQAMPILGSDEWAQLVLALKRVHERALAGQGGADFATLGVGAQVALMEALRQSGRAQQQAQMAGMTS